MEVIILFGKKKQHLSSGAVAGLPQTRRTRETSSWFLLGALAFAIAAGLAVTGFLRAAVPSVPVYVLKSDLRPGETISAGMLEKRTVPAVAAQADRVTPEDAEGKHARSFVAAGDILRAAHLTEITGSPVASRLALEGDPALRAVALPKEASQGLNIEPGDRVDIYAYVPVQGAPADAGFLVARAAPVMVSPVKDENTGQESGVTIAVRPEAVAQITGVLGMNGKLLVVAVPPGTK